MQHGELLCLVREQGKMHLVLSLGRRRAGRMTSWLLGDKGDGSLFFFPIFVYDFQEKRITSKLNTKKQITHAPILHVMHKLIRKFIKLC